MAPELFARSLSFLGDEGVDGERFFGDEGADGNCFGDEDTDGDRNRSLSSSTSSKSLIWDETLATGDGDGDDDDDSDELHEEGLDDAERESRSRSATSDVICGGEWLEK